MNRLIAIHRVESAQVLFGKARTPEVRKYWERILAAAGGFWPTTSGPAE